MRATKLRLFLGARKLWGSLEARASRPSLSALGLRTRRPRRDERLTGGDTPALQGWLGHAPDAEADETSAVPVTVTPRRPRANDNSEKRT